MEKNYSPRDRAGPVTVKRARLLRSDWISATSPARLLNARVFEHASTEENARLIQGPDSTK